jgi:hypothetical protein
MLPFLFSNFVEKWYLPQGTISRAGRVCIGDTDHDGHNELIFSTYGVSFKIFIYELHLPDSWEVDSFFCAWDWLPHLWDIGDFDLDGLYDLAIQTAVGTPPVKLLSITESPDSFSYPTQEVWRDTVGCGISPICVYDIDQDGLPEIVKVQGDFHLHIYETIGDNLYEKIAEITTSLMSSASSPLAFGDFDSDNHNEFVWGYLEGAYSVWECVGNNMYEELYPMRTGMADLSLCSRVIGRLQGALRRSFLRRWAMIPMGRNWGQISTCYIKNWGRCMTI